MWTNFDEVFILLDSDENQILDQKEFVKVPAHPLLIVPREKAYLIADTDQDGLVNLTEWFQLFLLLNNILMKTTTPAEMRLYTYYMQDTLAIKITPTGEGEYERLCWAGPKICDKIVGKNAKLDETQTMRKEGTVDELAVEELTPSRFFREYLSQNKPLLIKGGAKGWAAVTRWTDAYLNETVGEEHVKAERSKTKQFGYEDSSWGAVSEEGFTWSDFLSRYADPPPAAAAAAADAATANGTETDHEGNHVYVSSSIPRKMAPDVELPTNLIPCLSSRHEWTLLWMGSGGQNSLVHNDQFDTMYYLMTRFTITE